MARNAEQDAIAAKHEFLAQMIQELRRPMTEILGFAQLLEHRHDDPEMEESLETIVSATRRVMNLMDASLEFSRAISGRLTLSLEPIRLSQVINQALDLVQPIAKKADIRLVDRSAECGMCFVMADGPCFIQVMIHILSNAIKFNRANGSVVVYCEVQSGATHRIMVRDTGRGIPTEEHGRIFEPYERLGEVTTEGSGLGLATARTYMELMYGSLTLVESGPDGSVFCLELPATEGFGGGPE